MIKSKLRSKILKIRKKRYHKKFKIDPLIVHSFLKKNNLKFKSLGGYYPCNYEIDDIEILNFYEKKKIKISFPIIKSKNQMDFFEYTTKHPFEINKYGILEPMSLKKIYPDILFIPLVAFDKNLNRLGYGGGFYDRYLEKIENIKNIVKIGIAFSYQKVKKIPTTNYDKKLDYIITEKEIIR